VYVCALQEIKRKKKKSKEKRAYSQKYDYEATQGAACAFLVTNGLFQLLCPLLGLVSSLNESRLDVIKHIALVTYLGGTNSEKSAHFQIYYVK